MSRPYEFRTEPKDHQRRALRKIIKSGGRQMLAVEAGLGKTKVVLDYSAMLAKATGRCVVLVAAPLSAVDTWEDEMAKHLPEDIRYEVHVINSGTTLQKADRLKDVAKSLPEPDTDSPWLVLVSVNLDVFSQNRRVKGTATVTTRERMKQAIRAVPYDLGVVDESHRIKGRNSGVSRVMGSLASHFPRRLALTGTVAPHSPVDFWAQMRWVNDDVLDTFAQFESLYVRKGGWMGKENVGFHNLDHLSQRLAPWVFTALADDCLDLPPLTDATIHVELTAKERKVYTTVAKEAMAEVEHDGGMKVIMTPQAVVRWMRLRQVTSGFISNDGIVHEVGDTKMRACTEKVVDLVEGGEKVVIFAHFKHDVARAYERLSKSLECPVEFIDGGVKAERRREIRKKFQSHDGPMVVVAQMRTVSLAVNEFVAARHAVFLSFSERHDDYIQARARLQRQGQTRSVTLWHVVARKSLDESILESYRVKGSMEQAVLAEAQRFALEQGS